MDISHTDLINAAYNWVLKNTSCGVAIKELHTAACNGERPDVIGFGAGNHSILIECKILKSDFLADQKKMFRIHTWQGMGTQRFYCCQTDLIKKEELPEGWGLLYVNNKLKVRCVYSPYKGNIGERQNMFQNNILAERGLMYSVLRRLQLKGKIEEIYKG